MNLEKADAIITICPDLEKYALAFVRNPKHQYMIENSIVETIKIKFPQKLHDPLTVPKEKKVLVYAGTFEEYQGIALLISSFQIVIKEKPEAFLLLIGGTEEQVITYQMLANKYDLKDHCAVYPRMPQTQVRSIIKQATLQVSPRIEGTNTPLKNYEQLASGIPVVATKIISHTQILTEDVCFLVEPTPQSLARGILTALNVPKKCEEKVKNAKSLYDKKYSRAIYEKKIVALLNSLR